MQYLLLIHDDPSAWMAMSDDETKATMGEYTTFTDEIRASGIMQAGAPLTRPNTARLVRVRDGAQTVSDGPYAETREQLAGYYIVECDNEADAVAAAARIPSARFGTIEVRALADMASM